MSVSAAEPVEPVQHVGGVAGLARLAVVDHVKPGLQLPLDHLGHGPGHLRAVGVGPEPGGPGQAAGVSGEDALQAGQHPPIVSPGSPLLRGGAAAVLRRAGAACSQGQDQRAGAGRQGPPPLLPDMHRDQHVPGDGRRARPLIIRPMVKSKRSCPVPAVISAA